MYTKVSRCSGGRMMVSHCILICISLITNVIEHHNENLPKKSIILVFYFYFFRMSFLGSPYIYIIIIRVHLEFCVFLNKSFLSFLWPSHLSFKTAS